MKATRLAEFVLAFRLKNWDHGSRVDLESGSKAICSPGPTTRLFLSSASSLIEEVTAVDVTFVGLLPIPSSLLVSRDGDKEEEYKHLTTNHK